EPPLRQHHHIQAVLRHVDTAEREHGHLRIPSLLMRARALATVRVWKKRLEHQAHSRFDIRGACGASGRDEGRVMIRPSSPLTMLLSRHTRRRALMTLLGGAAAWPLAARAQQKPARLALLGSGAAQSSAIFVDAVKQGLGENGLVEGQDYVLDVRWAEGEYGRFPGLATEVVQRNPRVILATTIAAVRAAQRASATIPIVMTTINDPVGAGLVASLARPAAIRPETPI